MYKLNGTPHEIYPKTVVWIDWGVLSRALKLSNSSNYDLNKSREGLSHLIEKVKTTVNSSDIELLIGFQILEAGSEERKKFFLDLITEQEIVLFYPTPNLVGFHVIYIAYMLTELMPLFISYLGNYETNPEILLKFRQRILSDGIINNLNFGSIPELWEKSAHELGLGFVESIEEFRERDKNISLMTIYHEEKNAVIDFLMNILKEHPFLLTNIAEVVNIPKEKTSELVGKFLQSDYFNLLTVPEIWSNLFASWIFQKDKINSPSDRSDLMTMLEIGLFADIGFVDGGTFDAWRKRPNRSYQLDIRRSGSLTI